MTVEPSKLPASGPTGASMIRWGGVVDRLGCLNVAPVVVYLRPVTPLRGTSTSLRQLAGRSWSSGSIGAATGTAAAALINDYAAASAAQKQTIALAFATLYRTVVLGMLQTLETIPAAVWLLAPLPQQNARGRDLFW